MNSGTGFHSHLESDMPLVVMRGSQQGVVWVEECVYLGISYVVVVN